MRVLPAVSEQGRNDAVAIWVPNQIFDKSDREGDISQERSPFRFCCCFSLVCCSHRGPIYTNADPSLYKATKLPWEQSTLTLGVQAFNLFNHAPLIRQ